MMGSGQMMSRCTHEMAFRLYRRETLEEVREMGRTARGTKPATDAGIDLWYCPADRDGCGRLVTPPASKVRT